MEVGPDVLQVLVIRADMKLDDDLTRIVDTTISTFGQIDILVSCDEQTFSRRVMLWRYKTQELRHANYEWFRYI